jgi:hypothetical protein
MEKWNDGILGFYFFLLKNIMHYSDARFLANGQSHHKDSVPTP